MHSRSPLLWWTTVGTGAALVVLALVHMTAHHFIVDEPGGLRTYEQILDYIANPVILVIEALFLVTVTIHAMLGLRSVLLDLNLGERGRRLVERGLRLLGSATLVYGLFLLVMLASRA
jgi:succinate dehydrogenase / fumarate reductase membrane anchor subunit